jgi:amino-acid N-acetyltransferase
MSAVRALLMEQGLPVADLDSAQVRFFVALDGDALVGVGGIEPFEGCALLRSVAVERGAQRGGVGSRLLAHIENASRAHGFTQLVLLTQTATAFFQRHGYRVVDRADAPVSVHSSAEFRTLCPASAVCMVKVL